MPAEEMWRVRVTSCLAASYEILGEGPEVQGAPERVQGAPGEQLYCLVSPVPGLAFLAPQSGWPPELSTVITPKLLEWTRAQPLPQLYLPMESPGLSVHQPRNRAYGTGGPAIQAVTRPQHSS